LIDDDLRRIDGIGLSVISTHNSAHNGTGAAPCCTIAKALVLRRFTPYADLGSQLAAVPLLIEWGPVSWPMHWCALDAEHAVGDCGVHADVAAELLTAAGTGFVRARAALRVRPEAVAHWRARWHASEASDRWIGDAVVHHEVIRVDDRWWDPTEASWFAGAGADLADGRVVAVRDEYGPWTVEPNARCGGGPRDCAG
jgi:hypothetical protein